jgi:hypothetical protein
VMSMSNNHVRGFNKGPLEIAIGLLAHGTITCLSGT